MVINKKIKRTIRENKSQYVSSLVLIILSCFLYTTFNQLTSNLNYIKDSFNKNYVQEDAEFTIDSKLYNIPKLESRFNMIIEETGSFEYTVSKDKTKNDKILRVFTENTKVNIPAITEGRALKAEGILIDPLYAKANKINIGDSIKVYNKTFQVNGFMSLPNYIYPIKSESDLLNDPNNFGIAVITWKDYNLINMGSSSYSIKFKDPGNDLDGKINQFKDYLKSKNIIIVKWMNITENPRATYVTSKIESMSKMSTSMPIAVLLLTCILIGAVMGRMLKSEAIIIGTLYALGYRKKEIMKHYLSYPLIVSLLGGILGTILGAVTVKPMVTLMISYFNMPVGSIDFNVKYVIASILLPVVFLIFSSYFVINKSLKASPLELMKGGKDKNKVNFLEKKLKLDKLKFNTKFKIREQLRSIPRSSFMLLGVLMATMLMLVGFTEKSSIDSLMKDTYTNTYKYQYQYLFNTLMQGKPAKGEAFTVSPFSLKSDSTINFSVYGINPEDKYLSLKDKAGNELSFDKVIITKPLAETLKAKPGDTIKVINKLDSKEYSITIDEIAESYVGNYIYMPLQKLNVMLKYPSHSYIGIWSNEAIKIPENQLLSTSTIDDLKNAFTTMTDLMQYTMYGMSFFSFIIGLLVIYVVTSLVIEENKENISLIKVLGYRKKEINSLILSSSSFIIVAGYILGVPLTLLSMAALFKSLTKSLNFTLPVKISYIYVLIGFVVTYMTYELTKALSKNKVNKISMNEALKSGLE